MCFGISSFNTSNITNYIKFTMSTMVNQLTTEQVHKEFKSFMDKISAKFEQLDSGKFVAVGTLAFNANQPNWQVSLLIWANFVKDWTCQWLHIFTGHNSSSIEKHLFRSKFVLYRQAVLDREWMMQPCFCRSVRITSLDCGVKGIELCKQFKLSQSMLSTWKKKQRSKLNEMVDAGKVLHTKCNHESFLPREERALHLWFCEMRYKKHAPLINQALLFRSILFLSTPPAWVLL